ncbi:hypothetical protein BDQ17DRAFT_1373543 [Cyathus striatus]|nr:hypothetical protein BDQ17DRAFT_1373543 [Cyathus striatus]
MFLVITTFASSFAVFICISHICMRPLARTPIHVLNFQQQSISSSSSISSPSSVSSCSSTTSITPSQPSKHIFYIL